MKAYYIDNDAPYKHTFLAFPREWIGTKLPLGWRHPYVPYPNDSDQTRYFKIELVDTEDGDKILPADKWPIYSEYDYDPGLTSIHIYSYLEHYCPCHRKSDAEAAGADTDDECEGERFVIRSITVPTHMPGLIIYSETLKAAELEALVPPEYRQLIELAVPDVRI